MSTYLQQQIQRTTDAWTLYHSYDLSWFSLVLFAQSAIRSFYPTNILKGLTDSETKVELPYTTICLYPPL